jgi:hypothetical protein
VEEADCLDIPRDRPDVDIFDAETSGLCNGLLRKECPYPATAMARIHDDRLELGLLSVKQEATESENFPGELRNPESVQLGVAKVLVEFNPRVWATERRVVVDVAMALREAPPELPTSIEVVGMVFANGY